MREKSGFLQVGPKKWFFPSGYKREAEHLYNFVARPTDVFIVTFPRSGTTWTQELVWLLANDLDYETANKVLLAQRFPFLEFSCFVHKEVKANLLKVNQFDPPSCKLIETLDYPSWKYLDTIKENRFIKTHLPFSLLPSNLLNAGSKVIYVARHPKDVAVSYYHLNRTYVTQGYVGDFKNFWKYFQSGLVAWGPYWEHLKEGWSRRHEKNVLFYFYEDMKKNPIATFRKLATFLGKNYSDEELSILENHLRIDNFKNNKSVNNDEHRNIGLIANGEESFIRKGVIGGWTTYFDENLSQEADRWIEDNLRSSNIVLPY
ncbi:luciferin sulfotransferase-like [Diorhabda carinulata]|uniref:luciferin sulfotransferase-like n=1 Tax=Diorhabda carinulata TaxID=1163345 RepID=UPI0025A1BDC3|nr:luciferin sulfotransferase-like [Diorhabda carinulata]XP_057652155.1 luciferin sulfotransferase-like [Diorhabda carinulata]